MTLTISSDHKLGGDDDYEPNYDDYDEENFSDTFSDLGVDDNDEADADFGEPAYKKRKRAVTTTSKPRTMDSITNASRPPRRRLGCTGRKGGRTCLVSWVFASRTGMEGGTYLLLHLLVVALFT